MAEPEEEIYQYSQGDKAPDPSDVGVTYRQSDDLPPNGSGGGSDGEVDPGASYAVSPTTAGDPSAIQNPGPDWSILGAVMTDPMGVPLPQYVDPTRTLGPFDAYCAIVVQTFSTTSVHPVTNCSSTIEVRRCSVSWDADYNYPKAGARSMASAGPTPTLASPFPFPTRHDQSGYIVKVGDVVSVIQGRDGRAWYMVDDLPFVGTVWGQITKGYDSLAKFPVADAADPTKRAMVDDIALAADSSKYYRFDGLAWVETPGLSLAGPTGMANEVGAWHAGNAGYWCIDVRRRILGLTGTGQSADPAKSCFDGATSPLICGTGDDLESEANVFVTYRHVRVVCPPQTHHGYRPGDPVLVYRRGQYLFCGPGRQFFFAKIVDGGPQGEPDFDDSGDLAMSNHYWVKEMVRIAEYKVANAWHPTSTVAELTIPSTPPQMAVPTFMHWVDAINLPEPAGSHKLAVDGTEMVIVHIFANPETGQPWYAFERINWTDPLCSATPPW